MSALHTDITNDRQFTQLAYEVGFYPYAILKEQAKRLVVYSKSVMKEKWELVNQLNEDQTLLDNDFLIRWKYNNIPTKTEWDGFDDDALFSVQYRISPAIKDNNGRVAILSLVKR